MRCHLRSDVCNKLFLSFGAFDWHQKQVDTAWALGPAQGKSGLASSNFFLPDLTA